MPDHPYGLLSLLPPVAAIVLAIATRRVVLSLLAGILAGAVVLNNGNLLYGIGHTLEYHLWETIKDPFYIRIYLFVVLMGGLISVISRAGGMHSLIESITPWANNRRRGQMATWLSGMLIFFDDYANTLLLGNTMRPLSDRLRISREKLAFIVDSTAAPMAGLAPLSTWVAVEVSYIKQGLDDLGPEASAQGVTPFGLFLWSMPYRFYAIWMLAMVALLALSLRDFGPMREAERLAVHGRRSPGNLPTAMPQFAMKSGHWTQAVIPVLVTIGVLLWLLYQSGIASWVAEHPGGRPTFSDAIDILGGADSAFALSYGALAGLATATLMTRLGGLLSWTEYSAAVDAGVRAVLPSLAILICAVTLSNMTRGTPSADPADRFPQADRTLYSGTYLSSLLLGADVHQETAANDDEAVAARRTRLTRLLPTLTFILSGIMAFCTGTSYGTMGILMPMTVGLAFDVLGGPSEVGPQHPILLGSIGSILAGSIFGDHCSPISDTTVLSSQASGCDHIAHVWTQMPYALTVGAVSIVCGTLPLGYGVSVWILLPLGLMALVALLFVAGRPVSPLTAAEAAETEQSPSDV